VAQTRLSKVRVFASYSTASVTHSLTYYHIFFPASFFFSRFISALNDVGDETAEEYSPDVSKDDVSKKVRHFILCLTYNFYHSKMKKKNGSKYDEAE
jgi:hypothetical protein